MLEEIEELTNPKIRAGKKALSAEQQQMKQLVLSVLDTVRDESGKDAAVRLVFEPRTSKIDRDEFTRTLLAHTSMEGNAPINLVMIGGDGRPRCKPLTEVLLEWIEFRIATVRVAQRTACRESTTGFTFSKAGNWCLLSIDKVIKLIRNSDEPKPDLIKAFKLSERQADDILELRLRQLARLEGFRIEQELAELRKEQSALGKLLGSDAALRKLVGKEIEDDAKKYGDKDPRRTLIETAERATRRIKGDRRTDHGHRVQERVRACAHRARHRPRAITFKTGDALYERVRMPHRGLADRDRQ